MVNSRKMFAVAFLFATIGIMLTMWLTHINITRADEINVQSFATGSCTESDPKVLSSAGDLAQLAYLVNLGNNSLAKSCFGEPLPDGKTDSDVYIKLGSDINLADLYGTTGEWTSPDNVDHNGTGDQSAKWLGWTPIGNSSNPFVSQFDGAGYKVTNMMIGTSAKPANVQYAGLFGYVTNGEIKNIGVDANVTSSESYSNVGDLIGYANAYNSATLTISNSYATGNVTASGDSSNIGGLIGYAYATSSATLTISNSYATGNVTASGDSSNIGGLIGYAYATSSATLTISNSYARDNVTASGGSPFTGGLIGFAYASSSATLTISNSYATGNVTASGSDSYAGGLIGYAEANNSGATLTISNSYATGNVTATGSDSFTGGLIGYAGANNSGTITISNSVALNKQVSVANGTNIGRIVADTTVSAVNLINNYALESMKDGTTAPINTCGVESGGGKTVAESGNKFTDTAGDTGTLINKNGKSIAWTSTTPALNDGTNIFWSGTPYSTGDAAAIDGLGWSSSNWVFENGKLPVLKSTDGTTISGQNGDPASYITNPTGTASYFPTADLTAGGTAGDETHPYQISTAWQLAQLACLVNSGNTTYSVAGANYQLQNDINLTDLYGTSGEWTDPSGTKHLTTGSGNDGAPAADETLNLGWMPIGISSTSSFKSQFDGAEHKVSNMIIGTSAKSASVQYAGLFGYVTNGEIKNIGIDANVITSETESYAGGLIGYAYSKNSATITITNSYATGSVTTSGEFSYAGGLIGYADSHNSGTITITNSYATGNVTATESISYAGGLIGCASANNSGTITISNSYATGNVTATGSDSYAGGLIGCAFAYNSGPITITNSYATGNVTASGSEFTAGGLIGYADLYGTGTITITNSYATGNVTATGSDSFTGGLIGYAGAYNSGTITISNSVALNKLVSGTDVEYTGRVVGYFQNVNLINNYALESMKLSNDGGTTWDDSATAATSDSQCTSGTIEESNCVEIVGAEGEGMQTASGKNGLGIATVGTGTTTSPQTGTLLNPDFWGALSTDNPTGPAFDCTTVWYCQTGWIPVLRNNITTTNQTRTPVNFAGIETDKIGSQDGNYQIAPFRISYNAGAGSGTATSCETPPAGIPSCQTDENGILAEVRTLDQAGFTKPVGQEFAYWCKVELVDNDCPNGESVDAGAMNVQFNASIILTAVYSNNIPPGGNNGGGNGNGNDDKGGSVAGNEGSDNGYGNSNHSDLSNTGLSLYWLMILMLLMTGVIGIRLVRRIKTEIFCYNDVNLKG